MKLFFLSDIHGSAFYLRQALEAYKREQAEWIVLLGDVLYHGARNPLPDGYAPKEVIALLTPLAAQILAVRGNCESEVDAMVLPFPVQSGYSHLLLDGRRFFLTHGHLYDEKHLPPLTPGSAFCFGHTHVPRAEKQGELFLFNPGSITLPKEGAPHTYAVLEDGCFTVKSLDGTVYRSIRMDA